MNERVSLAVRHALSVLPPGTRLLCALSGGADSVAMTHCVMRLALSMGLEVRAAHFNHHLRGAESDRDEQFVRNLCVQWGLPLVVGGGTVQPEGNGMEDAARQLRYAFLRQTAEGARILTAHTMDDQAETVLLQLIRGTGLKGLGGIAPQNGELLRPLLEVRRTDVLDYLAAYGLSHVEDSSNAEDAYRRNRLRHQLLPLLARENPRITETLAELARRARQEEQLLSAMTATALELCRGQEGLHCGRLRQQPEALQSRILRAYVPMELNARHTAALLELCGAERSTGSLSLPGGWSAVRAYDWLRLEREDMEQPKPCRLSKACVVEWSGWRISCEKCEAPPEISQFGYTFHLAYDTIIGELELRSRQTGDVLHLPGGTRSLKRLMIDRKIPVRERNRIPVLADAAGVLAVPGLGMDRLRQACPGQLAWRITMEPVGEDGDE